MERKTGKFMLNILFVGISERTQTTLSHGLRQSERVTSLEVDVFVDQRRQPSHIFRFDLGL
jgi:hypothetical protein